MKDRMLKIFSLLLAVGLLAGCAASGASGPEQSASAGQARRLVNPQPQSGELPYAMEYPSIQDPDALSVETLPGEQKTSITFSNGDEEVRAVWISYLEMETLLKNKSEAQFKKNMQEVFDNVKDFGLNTVVVQVRPFGDALYKSEYFPWSYIITGTEGKDPGFDPLEIMVSEAKSRGLRFDAWVNPYRVRAAGNSNALSSDNQAKKWLDAGDGAVIRYGGIISYNPASEKARGHIIDGIREIVRNYNIDAVHIDDYFYPTTDTAFDSGYYSAYTAGGGALSVADWRRSNVEALISGIYAAVKEEDSKVLFGISPGGNMGINYDAQYLDVEKIATQSGYCDYICPQVYYGFQNESQPFAEVLRAWNDLAKTSPVDLYVGIAVYKLGSQDNYAGSGKDEWVSTTTILKEMVEEARALSACTGFVLYRYDSVFNPNASVASQVNRECENLKKIL